MIKARVLKPFYQAENKELYLDEERFEELKNKGYVEEIKQELNDGILTASKKINGKRKVLPKQDMETR